MPNEELKELNRKIEELIRASFPDTLEERLRGIRDFDKNHNHDGVDSSIIQIHNLFGEFPSRIQLETATIATKGNTDGYIICPISGILVSVDFSGVDALA